VPTRVYEPSSNGVNLACAPAALKHDPAESGPFAGNARFCGRGGQIVVGWRQRTGGGVSQEDVERFFGRRDDRQASLSGRGVRRA